MAFVSTEDSLGKALMLVASERMTEALDILRRFKALTWDEVDDVITVGVWNETTQKGLFEIVRRARNDGVSYPGQIPNLEIELRRAISQSFHVVDKIGGISGLGSMVFRPQDGARSWFIYNPKILTANFNEGNFGRISGNPRMGKTNVGCVIMEQWAEEGKVAFSNVLQETGDERYFYVKDAKDLFTNVSQLDPKEKWIFILDEGGLLYSKADAATRRNKDLDKFVRVVGKLHGSLIIIEQRPESVPTILQEFATCLFYCEKPGRVHIELRGPKVAFRDTVQDFPRTTLPYQTYDIGYWALNVNLVSMFSWVSGAVDPKAKMAEFIASGGMTQVQADALARNEEGYKLNTGKCQRCGKSLAGLRPQAKYCSKSCSVQENLRRKMEETGMSQRQLRGYKPQGS